MNYKGASTDEDGVFNFKDIQSGTYQISSSFLGYKTKKNKVTISNNDNDDLVTNDDDVFDEDDVNDELSSSKTVKQVNIAINLSAMYY